MEERVNKYILSFFIASVNAMAVLYSNPILFVINRGGQIPGNFYTRRGSK